MNNCKAPKCFYSKKQNECVKPNPYTVYISNCIKNGTDIDKCRINYYKNKDKIKNDVCNLLLLNENDINIRTCPRYRRPVNNKCFNDYKVIKINRHNTECCYKKNTINRLIKRRIRGRTENIKTIKRILENTYISPKDFKESINSLSLKYKNNLFDQLLKSSNKNSKEFLKILSKSISNKSSLKSSNKSSLKSPKEPSLKSSKEPSLKSSKEPLIKSSKEPLLKSSKEASLKSSKEPLIKSSKEPLIKSSKEPLIKSSKEPLIKSPINVFYKSKESSKLNFNKDKNKYYRKIYNYQNKIKPIKTNKIKSLTPKKETPQKPKTFFQKILKYIGIQ